MPIQPVSFNPLSWQQASAPLEAAQMGQGLAQGNLNAIYQPQLLQQELLKNQLANAVAQQQLPYAGQQAQANVGLTQAQGAQAGATALGTNVGTTSNLLTSLRQLQIARQLLAKNGGDTSQIDNSIAQMSGLLNQVGGQTGFGSGIGNSLTPGVNQNPPSMGSPLPGNQPQNLQNMNSNGGNSNALGPSQMQRLAQILKSGGGTTGIQSSANIAPSTSPQIQQVNRSADAQNDALLGSLSGNPELAGTLKDIYNNQFHGTQVQKNLAINDAEQMKGAIGADGAARQMLPLLQQYQHVLAQTPKADFLPGVRDIAGTFSPNFRTLENISNQLTQYSKEFTNMPAKAFTNQELNLIKSSWADPKQSYASAQTATQTMSNIIQRVMQNKQMMQDYFNKNGTLNNYQPYTGANNNSTSFSSSPSSSVIIQGQDGKKYSIPSNNLQAALKRGAKQVG